MKLSFAQFPKWKDLPKAERSSLFGQACQLWEAKEYDKAEQLFRYLWENDYSAEDFSEYAEKADARFQLFYARLQTDFLSHGNVEQALRWLKRAAENGCTEAKERLEDWPPEQELLDHPRSCLEALNKRISDAYYKTHTGPWDIFMGEQCAMLNEHGHVEFVERECCQWNPINGAEGLILAKDEPVTRKQFKMTGFSPELEALLTKISKNKSAFNCYPNIIDATFAAEDATHVFGDEISLSSECETWKTLLELLEHGYSLVQQSMYTMQNSNFMPPAVHTEIEEYRQRFLTALREEARKPSTKRKKPAK